jgi:hypothetical protein
MTDVSVPLRQKSLVGLAILIAVMAAGCSTASRSSSAGPSQPSLSAPKSPASGPTTAANNLPAGEYPVRVESEPSGAMVVVNGIPIGKTPQRVILPGTPRGFCREQVSLKVRFIAPEAGQSSQTVEELLTPLDKIPAAVSFTPAGTTRVAR